MPGMNSAQLAGEITGAVFLYLAQNPVATDTIGWEESFIKHFQDALEDQVGTVPWVAGDLDNGTKSLATALGQAGTKHFLAIVGAIATAVVLHIQTNAVVTTAGTAAAQTGTVA